MDMSLFSHFIFSFIATTGYAIFFNVPRKQIVYCGFVGAIGWLVCVLLNNNPVIAPAFANFVASLVITLLSEKLARILKKPAILFIIPGIIPLVPGGGLYRAMLSFVQGDYDLAISTGIETLLISGSIAIGIMVTTSIYTSIKAYKTKILSSSKK